ncbi:MAG: alpha/beta hydrolase, partial [Steroidobacteraceae bacterium]|nr:alpha/beta hydrolase [Steroidobacteraceae bacterium]
MRRIHCGVFVLGAVFAVSMAVARTEVHEKVLLWPNGAPGALADAGDEKVRVTEQGDHVVSNVHKPSLTLYLPRTKGVRAAVVVAPGGGYRELWSDHEGHDVAKALNEQGIAAFVLFYRLPAQEGSTYKREVDSLADIQRAVRTVRARAAEWSIDPKKVGVLGFSAGGNLVMQASTKFDAGAPAAADPIDRLSSRPDFAAPIYTGFSDWKIDANTPPMFILCGGDDRPQVVSGMTQIYLALRAAQVPAELHLYDGVGHGFGLRATNKGPVTNWL